MNFKNSEKCSVNEIEQQNKVVQQVEKIQEESTLKQEEYEKKSLWQPTYRWYIKTAGIILVILIAVFFVLNVVLKPYIREINPEITPWLK